MVCLLLGSICVISAALALVVWQKWIAPWGQIDQLVRHIAHGEEPRTFLVNGGVQAQRLGLALENIFRRQQQLAQQVAGRESGTQTILGVMQDGLLVVDSHRRVALINPAFERMFELRNGSVGAPLLEIVRHATLDWLIADTLRAGKANRSEMSLTNSQTNAARHVAVSAVPIKQSAGGTTGAVVLFHDITELKRLDQIRRDFVANVSHELRTPLSILRGYIETLLDSPQTSGDELSRILRVMERHSKRLDLLAEELLTLAQLESANPDLQLGTVDLSSFLGEVMHDWEKKLAKKQLNVIIDVPSDFPMIRGDRTRLQEALYNLLDNAVKYSHEHGEIRLIARRHYNEIALIVSDNGVGIAKEDLPRIFERFYRVDKARSHDGVRGTGLGLAIVKHIAQLHGGRVEAESELSKGTTIRMVLPVVTQK
jgi:two-component system, OmpR family, phosphate regulon sensor histidine kinase PhoR